MSVKALEVEVNDGQIRLPPEICLPDHTTVYVLIPDVRTHGLPHIATPRLKHPERAAELRLEVTEEEPDAAI